MEISDYLEEVEKILERMREWTKIRDNERITIALGVLAERAKDRRMAEMQKLRAQAVAGEPGAAVKPWRQELASPDQLAFLQRHEIPHAPDIKKGEASDLIQKRIDEWKK